MKAGRELDALIAEKVMGWRLQAEPYTCWNLPDGDQRIYTPNFSTDIAAAWRVVEKMRSPDFRLNREGDWVCCFGGTVAFCGDGDTAALAICRAALATLEDT